VAFENGVNWRPIEPEKRGLHTSFASAVEASIKNLSYVPDSFFDCLKDKWNELFPNFGATPGRREGNKLFLYVKSAPALFTLRSKLAAVKRTLLLLPGAPKRLEVYLEIRK
jgi:hypothetical protein